MSNSRETFPGKFAVTSISVPSVLLYILSLALGAILLAFSPLSQNMMNSQSIQHLEFFFVFFPTPLSLNLFTTTVLALSIYVACLMVALLGSRGYVNWLSPSRTGTNRIPNWLRVMPLGTSTLFLIVQLVTTLQDRLGIPTGDLTPKPLPVLFAALTTSPISEELNFRITTLGLIVAIRSISSLRLQGSRGTSLAYSFLFPDLAKTRAGLDTVASAGIRRGIHWSEWMMLTASSTIFGLSHLAAGSGWEVGKVTTAAIVGFVMGMVFLVYGAHATILVHWFFNYYTQVFGIGTMAFDRSSQMYQIFAILDNLVTGWANLVGLLGVVLMGWFLLWSRKSSEQQ